MQSRGSEMQLTSLLAVCKVTPGSGQQVPKERVEGDEEGPWAERVLWWTDKRDESQKLAEEGERGLQDGEAAAEDASQTLGNVSLGGPSPGTCLCLGYCTSGKSPGRSRVCWPSWSNLLGSGVSSYWAAWTALVCGTDIKKKKSFLLNYIDLSLINL